MSEPLYRTFKKRRLTKRSFGIILGVLGLVFLAATRFRLPLPSALLIEIVGGIALIALGILLFSNSYSAPVREVLLLAEDRKNALTPADLVKEMDLEIDDARKILGWLERQGILRKAENAEAYLPSSQASRAREQKPG